MFTKTYIANGLQMTDAFGTSYPAWFTHPLEEYEALTGKVAMIDLTHWATLRLTGSDRVGFLNSMVTNDVQSLAEGHACHAALTTIKGKMVAELFILRRPEEIFVVVAQGNRDSVVAALEKHIIADDVTVTDTTSACGMLSVEGPLAREIVWRLFPTDPLPLEPLAFIDTDYQGAAVTVFRNSVTGERGFQLIIGVEHIERIREYLVQAGRGMDMALCGRAAWNMRRVENGNPWFGTDVTEDNFPKETRFDDVVSYSKGCFLGQETLARMHHRGHPNWLLVGLKPAGDVPATLRCPSGTSAPPGAFDISTIVATGTELTSKSEPDKAAGRITSAVFSPALAGPLFLGLVRMKHVEAGALFETVLADSTVALETITLPIEGERK